MIFSDDEWWPMTLVMTVFCIVVIIEMDGRIDYSNWWPVLLVKGVWWYDLIILLSQYSIIVIDWLDSIAQCEVLS